MDLEEEKDQLMILFHQGNLEKLKKIGSPKALTDHVKFLIKNIPRKIWRVTWKIGTLLILNLFVSHDPKDYEDKDKKVDPTKVESFKFEKIMKSVLVTGAEGFIGPHFSTKG